MHTLSIFRWNSTVILCSLLAWLIHVFSAMADFTDEEGYGRYLDMHECYEKYINLKGVDVSVHPKTAHFVRQR